MAEFLIYCDNLQEGIWFQEMDPHFDKAKIKIIPKSKEEIERLGLQSILKYDRPDIILQDNNETILVLERTVEVPSGHNVGQRYGRLLAAAEARIPAVYFGPYAAKKHGGKTSGPRWMNLRLFYALRRVSEYYNTAITTIKWPVDDKYEVLRNPEKDTRLKEYLECFFKYYGCNGKNGLTEHMLHSDFQKQQYDEQIEFAHTEIKNPKRYDFPPPSVEVIPLEEFNHRYDLDSAFGDQETVILYHVGMTKIRSDPYAGAAGLYNTLYGDGKSVVILDFPKISRASWDSENTEGKIRVMFKAFSDGIKFNDCFSYRNEL